MSRREQQERRREEKLEEEDLQAVVEMSRIMSRREEQDRRRGGKLEEEELQAVLEMSRREAEGWGIPISDEDYSRSKGDHVAGDKLDAQEQDHEPAPFTIQFGSVDVPDPVAAAPCPSCKPFQCPANRVLAEEAAQDVPENQPTGSD